MYNLLSTQDEARRFNNFSTSFQLEFWVQYLYFSFNLVTLPVEVPVMKVFATMFWIVRNR